MDNQIVVYRASDGNELAVKTDGETVWLTIDQMVKLLGRDRTVLVRHINNAIKEGELRRDINVQNLHNIQSDCSALVQNVMIKSLEMGWSRCAPLEVLLRSKR